MLTMEFIIFILKLLKSREPKKKRNTESQNNPSKIKVSTKKIKNIHLSNDSVTRFPCIIYLHFKYFSSCFSFY